MKTIAIILFTILSSISSLMGQIDNITWDYPLRPGVKAWEDIESYDDRLKALNIPESILKKMSTANLVTACLNYPELRLIMTRNSLQLGYDYILSIFNGFTELESRKDGGKQLLVRYMELDPQNIKFCKTPLERGEYSFKIVYLELILSQTQILRKLEQDEKVKILKYATDYYKSKDLLKNNYSQFGQSTTALLLGRFLDVEQDIELVQQKKQDNQLREFLDHTFPLDKTGMDAIFEKAKKYLKNLNYE